MPLSIRRKALAAFFNFNHRDTYFIIPRFLLLLFVTGYFSWKHEAVNDEASWEWE